MLNRCHRARGRLGRSTGAVAAFGLLVFSASAVTRAQDREAVSWVTSWAAVPDSAGPPIGAKSVRQIVRTSIGGPSLRLRFSNLFGTAPVTIGPVRVAASAGGSATKPGTDRPATFGGKPTVTIPKGADAVSDPVAYSASPLETVAVSISVAASTGRSTIHGDGRQRSYFSNAADSTAAAAFPAGETSSSRFFLTALEVAAGAGARAIVVVGDSMVDGHRSTEDGNARWPDALASRLQADSALASIAVVNAGVSGNRLLKDGPVGPSLLSRFDRDVLDRGGVRWVLLETGINDIGMADERPSPEDDVSAEQVIEGMKALIARAHAKGIAIWGATLLPYSGAERPLRFSPAGDAKRREVNRWIRTAAAFDAVIDFERVVRDPSRPDRILPAFDSGDHLHPNDAGYRAMAESLDVRLFTAESGIVPSRDAARR